MTENVSTALVPYEENSSALLGLGIGEGAEPLNPTVLTLIQRKHVEDDPTLIGGRFLDTQANMQFESLDVVVLEILNGRTMFPPGGYQAGIKPLCRAAFTTTHPDKLVPITNNPELIPQDGGKGCAKCPKSQWFKIQGRNIKPECQETRSLLLAEVDTGFVYRYNAKGRAVTPAKDLRETLRKLHLKAKARGVFIPPYAIKVRLSSTYVKEAKGNYYVPKFSPYPEALNHAQREQFKDIYEYYALGRGREENVDDTPVSSVLNGEYVQEPPAYEAA